MATRGVLRLVRAIIVAILVICTRTSVGVDGESRMGIEVATTGLPLDTNPLGIRLDSEVLTPSIGGNVTNYGKHAEYEKYPRIGSCDGIPGRHIHITHVW